MAAQRRFISRKVATAIILLLNFTVSLGNNDRSTCGHGDIRLTGGPNEFEGRVEICLEGVWGQVCGNGGWVERFLPATIVCRNLGFITGTTRGYSRNGNIYGQGNVPPFIDSVVCDSRALPGLIDCTYVSINTTITGRCPNDTTAAVVCPDMQCASGANKLQLVNGTENQNSDGSLEVCLIEGGSERYVRTGVCSQNWDDHDARVVCQQLGRNGTEGVAKAIVGSRSKYGFILNSSIECSGDEANFSECFRSHTMVPTDQLTPESGCLLAEVQCPSEATVSSTTTAASPTPSRLSLQPTSIPTIASQTIDLSPIPSTSPTTLLTQTLSNVGPTATLSPTPTPTTTVTDRTQPEENSTMYILIAIVVGGVVFVVLVIFVILVVVLIIIVGRKHMRGGKYSITSAVSHNTGNVNDRPLSSEYDDTVVRNLPSAASNKNSSEYEETERVLINPIYKKSPLLSPSTGYTKILTPVAPNHYTTPTSPSTTTRNGASAGPVLASGPITDDQGYASLEVHVQQAPYPYEVPLSPPNPQNGRPVAAESEPPHVYDSIHSNKSSDGTSSHHGYKNLQVF